MNVDALSLCRCAAAAEPQLFEKFDFSVPLFIEQLIQIPDDSNHHIIEIPAVHDVIDIAPRLLIANERPFECGHERFGNALPRNGLSADTEVVDEPPELVRSLNLSVPPNARLLTVQNVATSSYGKDVRFPGHHIAHHHLRSRTLHRREIGHLVLVRPVPAQLRFVKLCGQMLCELKSKLISNTKKNRERVTMAP